MKFAPLALAGCLVTAGLSFASPAYSAPGDGVVHVTSDPVPGQYVVVLKSGVTNTRAVTSKLVGSNKVVASFSSIKGFSVHASATDAKRMATDPNVAGVYQDGYVHANAGDVSPSLTETVPAPPNTFWGLNRIDQRSLPSNSVAGTYVTGYTASNVNAYVIDTGIQTTHTQFGGRATFDFAATGIGGGAVDCHGHGTHVAGTIGGTTFGVAKSVHLHAVKVLDCTGSGTFTQVVQGVDFVRTHAVKPAVANMSLGGGFFQPLNDAVTAAVNSGVFFAVAAGNSNANACSFSPASTPAATTVGATGNRLTPNTPISDGRADYSNFGTCLDIFAPGSLIKSSCSNVSDPGMGCTGATNNRTTVISGTSMATPHVAGVAALFLSKSPASTPAAVNAGLVNFATNGVVTNPGTGSPNKLLYSGGIPTLSSVITPTSVNCVTNVTVVGTLALQGTPLSGRTVEIWQDPEGTSPAVFKGTAVTSTSGTYGKVVSQDRDSFYFAIYRGAPLIGAVQSSRDYVNCNAV